MLENKQGVASDLFLEQFNWKIEFNFHLGDREINEKASKI
jgi:hypothetical protein